MSGLVFSPFASIEKSSTYKGYAIHRTVERVDGKQFAGWRVELPTVGFSKALPSFGNCKEWVTLREAHEMRDREPFEVLESAVSRYASEPKEFDVEVRYQTQTGSNMKRVTNIPAKSEEDAIGLAGALVESQRGVVRIIGGDVKPSLPRWVVDAINDLSFEAAEDLLDEHLGVGCNDSDDTFDLRNRVQSAVSAGRIPLDAFDKPANVQRERV